MQAVRYFSILEFMVEQKKQLEHDIDTWYLNTAVVI